MTARLPHFASDRISISGASDAFEAACAFQAAVVYMEGNTPCHRLREDGQYTGGRFPPFDGLRVFAVEGKNRRVYVACKWGVLGFDAKILSPATVEADTGINPTVIDLIGV